MTLTQLSAFVLTARLGSVKEAAKTLNVSEPAVSQAITALRQHLGDPLIVRDASGMKLTVAGARLLPIASQMVALGAEAEAAVRVAQGLPEQLRLVTSSVIAEFIAAPLTEAFAGRAGRAVEASAGVAVSSQMPVLVANRLADMALGPNLAARSALAAEPGLGLVSDPVFKYQLVAVTSPRTVLRGAPRSWSWLVDPSGADPGSDVSALLRLLGVPDDRVRVFPNLTAAWDAAASGDGVAPAVAHLVARQIRRGELRLVDGIASMNAAWYATTLPRDRRPGVAGSLRHFLGTPEAMHLMREPRGGVPVSRFRPPVYVTIWS